jgi:CRP-like cAMP-binding protein
VNEKILDKLKKVPLFAEIRENDEYMKELLEISRQKDYNGGEQIIKEGEIGDEMYIVFTGGVEIRKKTRAGDDYTVIKLEAEQNVFFGELGLIDDDKRSATVIASRDSTFIVINKKDFLALGKKHPQICLPITLSISRILSSRLRKTTQDMLTIFDALVNEIKG